MKPIRSGADFYLSSNIRNKACELTSNCDTAFVLSHLAPCIQFAESICPAQLHLPGDVAYGFGLTFLAHFDGAAHPRVEAVFPGCFDENASGMFVTRLGDGTLVANVCRGEFRGGQSQILHQGHVSKARQCATIDFAREGQGEPRARAWPFRNSFRGRQAHGAAT